MNQILLGSFLLAAAAVFAAIGGHMLKSGLDAKNTETKQPQPASTPTNVNSNNSINITGNQAPVQVALNSPGASQVINNVNNKRVIHNDVKRELGTRGSVFVLKLTLPQTEGIWDAGQQFSLQIQFTGPYQKATFLSGYFPPNALTDVVTTSGVPEALAKGYFEHTTSTPPALGPIVVEFESSKKIDVAEIRAKPTDGYGAPR